MQLCYIDKNIKVALSDEGFLQAQHFLTAASLSLSPFPAAPLLPHCLLATWDFSVIPRFPPTLPATPHSWLARCVQNLAQT